MKKRRQSSAPTCDCGGKLPPGVVLCAECAIKLRTALVELDTLPSLLIITATKQSRGAPSARTQHGKGTPLPYNPAGTDALRRIAAALTRWVDVCNRGEPWPEPDTEAVWLETRLPRNPDAARALDELAALADRSRDVIDSRGALIFCGPCTAGACNAPLYRRRGDQTITCLRCCATHETTDRMKWLRDQLGDQILPAGLLVEALALLGHTVTENRVKVWAHRGRIPRKGSERAPRYAVADVLKLLAEQQARAAQRSATRHADKQRMARQTTTV